MKHSKNTKGNANPCRQEEIRRRIFALLGKYKGKGLMRAFIAGKKREKES